MRCSRLACARINIRRKLRQKIAHRSLQPAPDRECSALYAVPDRVDYRVPLHSHSRQLPAVVAIPCAILVGTYANASFAHPPIVLILGKENGLQPVHRMDVEDSGLIIELEDLRPERFLWMCQDASRVHCRARVSRHERFIIRVRAADPHRGWRHALQETSCADSCCQRQRDQPRRDGHSSVEHDGCTNFRRAGRPKVPMGCRRLGEYMARIKTLLR